MREEKKKDRDLLWILDILLKYHFINILNLGWFYCGTGPSLKHRAGGMTRQVKAVELQVWRLELSSQHSYKVAWK